MQKLVLVARVLLGLIFVVFSTNYFFGFFELPPPSPEGGQFIGAIIGTGYLFTFMKIVELLAGILLLAGKLVPLANYGANECPSSGGSNDQEGDGCFPLRTLFVPNSYWG